MAPEIVVRGSLEGVVLTVQVVECEAGRKGFLVQRIGRARQRMRFTGFGLALGADDMLDAGQREQVTEFGGVENIRSAHDRLLFTVPVRQRDGADAVAGAFDVTRPG